MIEINLVPPQLRKQTKGKMLLGHFKIPMEVIIGILGGVIFLLVFVHFILFFINFYQIAAYKNLQSQWEKIAPEKKAVDIVLTKLRQLQGDTKALEEITVQKQNNWSQKWNLLSDFLPKGVWLTNLDLKDDVFIVAGSSLSRQQKDISSVNAFTSSLKDSQEFMKFFADMELGSIQRRQLGTIDIVDFSIMFKLE